MLPSGARAVVEAAAVACYYKPYMQRQAQDEAEIRRQDALELPRELEYASIPSLSAEDVDVLSAHMPETLGAAARLPGVSPAALIALLRHVRQRGQGGTPSDAPEQTSEGALLQ